MGKVIGSVILGIVIVLAAVYALLAWRARPAPDYPFYDVVGEGPLVMAHQGGERLWPSNTMLAYENAVALGVDVLEMDVHATADGALVLIHDETVDRTTGASGAVKELTLAEIKALDAGYYWTADEGQTYPYRDQGVTMATLEEVLTAFPDVPLNIEIKQREPSIVAPLCQMLRDFGAVDRVLVASFHPEAMDDFRATCPEVATSMVEDEIRPFYVLNLLFLGGIYRPPATAFQVPEYAGNLHVVTRRFVDGAHDHNVAVHVWTVNETADMQRLLDLGVDGIITDRPDRMLELLGR